MNPYYLAIDIGASSGRHILAHLEDGKMVLEEVHRFPNGMVEKDGENSWDVDELFAQIKLGMKKCAQLGKIPVSVGVDTWGVDFVLLDGNGERIGNAVAYRDGRTKGMDEEVYKIISERDLYARTGIQKAIFNTIYQLMALKVRKPEQLAKAEVMLLMPDYFHYMLSGVAATEYTEATTGQMVSPETKDWDMELIEKLGYPKRIFQKMVTPGTVLGELTAEVQKEVGFNCKVVEPATHDTGSAVIAVPTDSDDALYISSGTWSLMGTEILKADCSPESMANNLTNEGGYDYRFRYLKNIMGLWMIQSVKKEIGGDLGYGEICEMASRCAIPSIVDCNDDRFLAPANMTEEVPGIRAAGAGGACGGGVRHLQQPGPVLCPDHKAAGEHDREEVRPHPYRGRRLQRGVSEPAHREGYGHPCVRRAYGGHRHRKCGGPDDDGRGIGRAEGSQGLCVRLFPHHAVPAIGEGPGMPWENIDGNMDGKQHNNR